MVKVIASSVRKGNVLDLDGKLAVVMTAENIHPGKGTPVTHLELRRIADGVKVTERYRTTDQVERAYLEEKDYNYLYEDDMGFNFMQPETFDQISVSKEVLGDQAVWLQEGMTCSVSPVRGQSDRDRAAGARNARDRRSRSRGQRPDGVVVLQAGEACERRSCHGAAAHRYRHPRHRHDGRRLLRRARQRLIALRLSI